MKKDVNDELGKAKTGKQSTESHRADCSEVLELFENALEDMYRAEKSLTVAIPYLVNHAVSDAVVGALEAHLKATMKHVTRLETVFGMIGNKPREKRCEGMEGLIKEAARLVLKCKAGPMSDVAIVSSAQKIVHYAIASYGTLRQFADTLELLDAAELLSESLEEEWAANYGLTEIAVANSGCGRDGLNAQA